MINWYLDTQFKPGQQCRIPVTGASADQLANIVWSEISAVCAKKWAFLRNRYTVNTGSFYCNEWKEGWYASLRTARAENPDALQGFHNCLFLIDEGSGVPDKIFEVARGAMGDPDSMGLMMGNPTRLDGYFYEVFNKKQSTWHTMHFSSTDSLADKEYSYKYVDPLGNIQIITHRGRQTQKWVDEMKADYGENSNIFKIRVLGEFASGDADTVIEERWLKNVFNMPKPEKNDRPVVMGVDIARFGSDSSGVVVRKGFEILHIAEWHGHDTVVTEQKIAEIADEFKPKKIFVDVIGVGGGVYDHLKNQGYPVEPCEVSKAAPKPEESGIKSSFGSLRDYIWWLGRLFLRTGKVCFNGEVTNELYAKLLEELKKITYSYRVGKVIVESKDEMKKRGVMSPNLADAFNMSLMYDNKFWQAPKKNKKRFGKSKKRRKRRRGYLTA